MEVASSSTAPKGGDYASSLRAIPAAWVTSWADTFRARSLRDDLLAGLTVAAVALPLNLGLAIASGMPPTAGIVAGVIGGLVAALFGGSSYQVSGPAAALSVMVLALQRDFGTTGVAAATLYVGIVEIALALALAGRVLRFVPESVLAGFTTGVGLKLLDQQLPELLGFPEVVAWASDGSASTIDIAIMMHHPRWLHDVSWLAAMSGLFVVFVVTTMRSFKRFPAAIVSIGVVTFVSVYLNWDIERVSSVGKISSEIPPASFPKVSDHQWLDLFLKATPLALLAGAESLLSAKAVDRMAQAKKLHDPNLELVGQGLANVFVGLFSGMPVTGVVARSGVNVQSGGKTRLAALFHAVFMACAVVFLSGYIQLIPLAALAGLLCVIGMRLIEVKTFFELVREHKLEAVAFLVAAGGTVSGHLVIGLVGGLAIHAVNRFLHRHEDSAAREAEQNKRIGVRAVLSREHAEARRPAHFEPGPTGTQKWLSQIRERSHNAKSSFVHPASTIIGRVVLGDHVHVAAGSSIRADEGTPFHIGDNTNIQDGVVMHALKDRRVMVGGEGWAVYVGKNVSIAHDALVHGPCYIGDDTFVGFKAVVHDSVVGSGCFIGIGAVVVGVEVPDGKFVPHGRIVDSADAVDSLPNVSAVQMEFNEDVVEVNRGLAAAYRAHEALVDEELPADLVQREARRRPPAWDARWERDSKGKF